MFEVCYGMWRRVFLYVCSNPKIRPAYSGFNDVRFFFQKRMGTFGVEDGGYRHELYIVNSVHTQASIQLALWAPSPE